jgi:hypothetical protein
MGVLTAHEVNRLKVWITRALEARARLNGWRSIVSDTTDNLPSANNFIRAGYRHIDRKIHRLGPIRCLAQIHQLAARSCRVSRYRCIRPVA